MKDLLLTDVYIPQGYEYLLDEKMPNAALSFPLVGLILVLIAGIAMSVMVGKKHKLEMLPVFAGATIFMFFNYFIVGLVTMFMPKGNVALFMALTSMLTAFVPFMGRLFFIKMFAKKYNRLKSHLGYGVGIMCMRGLMNLLTFIYPILYYTQINKNGVAAYFPADAKEETALEMAKNLKEILETEYSQYMLFALITIALMVYAIAATMPIYVAFKGKKSKLWYVFALGMGLVVSLAEVLYSNNILVIPSIIMAMVAAGVTAFFAIKLYKELAEEEKEEPEENNNDNGSISQNARVKIPKFSNLDKL